MEKILNANLDFYDINLYRSKGLWNKKRNIKKHVRTRGCRIRRIFKSFV